MSRRRLKNKWEEDNHPQWDDEEYLNDDTYDDYIDEYEDYDESEFCYPDIWDAFDVDPEEFGGDEDMLLSFFGRD
ncbi:MAG: hypothetical protein AB1304_01750 [Bacteroidota bacterium]